MSQRRMRRANHVLKKIFYFLYLFSRFQYTVGCMSCVTASMFTAAIGIENFLRLRALKNLESARHRRRGQPVNSIVHTTDTAPEHQAPLPPPRSVCSQFQVTVLNLTFWILAVVVVLVHLMLMPHLTFAICGDGGRGPSVRSLPNEKTLLFDSILALGAFLLSFVILGGLGFLKCACIMKSWSKPLPYITSREFALINSNFWNWLGRFLVWAPAIVTAVVIQFDSSTTSLLLSSPPYEPVPLPTGRVSLYFHPTITTTMGGRGEREMSTAFSSNTISLTGKDSQQDLNFMLQRLVFWSSILPSCLGSIIYACANKDFRRYIDKSIANKNEGHENGGSWTK